MSRCTSFLLLLALQAASAAEPTIIVDTPLPPPGWALLERELLRANAAACEEFFAKYFDERGFLLCVERWGGDDGPDDAIENCNDWPILHALGGSNRVQQMVQQAWEGHLRQFTLAKTVDVPFARDGMYYKEFPVMFDWLHNGEGLTVFNVMGLSDPVSPRFQQRVRRYAGFYMNEDPGAPNYDPQHKLIRSLFNGSRGPLLRPATALDWAGDPIEIEHRFRPGHGERSYAEMLEHFKDYQDIVGDHPSNLLTTCLAMNAYMLAGEEKYRAWLLEYVDAWRQRMLDNGGIIPTKIGLDGKIGGESGKWYAGVYGWGFSMVMPHNKQVVHRSTFPLGFNGFMNAYVLTGDDGYLDPWRKMLDLVNSHQKVIDGTVQYPSKYGDEGWYAFTPEPFRQYALELYYLSMDPRDRKWLAPNRWLDYLDGKLADYPEQALRTDLERIRTRVQGLRADTTTPDTRLSDDPMKFNPASVESLIQLTLGGLHPGHRGSILFSRLRYFDPVQRRAGLPEDVAALVEKLTADETVVTLVNVSPVTERELIVQAGSYGEHQFVQATHHGHAVPVHGRTFVVRLAPGCGSTFTLKMQRFINQPTLLMPWQR